MPLELTFYTTAHCHLCEQALALIEATPAMHGHWLVPVDIAADAGLVERYGTRIPVLASADGAELAWPFDARALEAFVRRSPGA